MQRIGLYNSLQGLDEEHHNWTLTRLTIKSGTYRTRCFGSE